MLQKLTLRTGETMCVMLNNAVASIYSVLLLLLFFAQRSTSDVTDEYGRGHQNNDSSRVLFSPSDRKRIFQHVLRVS